MSQDPQRQKARDLRRQAAAQPSAPMALGWQCPKCQCCYPQPVIEGNYPDDLR